MANTIYSFPIDFDLYNEEEEQVLFITDDVAGQEMTLQITNTSDKPLSPLMLDGAASASEHHFELVFRPSTLYNINPAINVKSDQFELFINKNNGSIQANADGTLSLFFKSKVNWMLQVGEKLRIKISNIRAEGTDGTRGTRVMLRYRNLLHDANQDSWGSFNISHGIGNPPPPTSDAFSGFREMHLNIVNHRGKKNIPLHAGFIGSNTVLNDGKSPNTLKLRIANISRKEVAIEAGAKSALTLVMEGGLPEEEWTLATVDQLDKAVVQYKRPGDAALIDATGTTEWIIPFVQLGKGQFIDLQINDLITDHPTGHANLYLHYENIPGYWDGEVTLVIEKSPMVFRDKKVSIGTPNSEGKLTVVPPEDGRGIEVLSPSAGNTHFPWTNNWNYISGNGIIFRDKSNVETLQIDNTEHTISMNYGPWAPANKKFVAFKTSFKDDPNRGQVHIYAPSNYYDNEPAITLAGNYGAGGNVGIGIEDPSERLEVKGNVKADAFIGAGAAVKGMIVMWSGELDAIPATWALCDGQNETPDLRNRFIVGAGNTYQKGATGGQDTIALAEQNLPAHAHSGQTSTNGNHQHWIEGTDADGLAWRQRTIPGQTTVDMGWGGGSNADPNQLHWRGHVNTDTVGNHNHSFTTDAAGGNVAHENRPPYYALAFIMKL